MGSEKTLMVDVLQDGGASVPGTGAFQWVLWAVFVQIVVLAGGWICYKALFPALRFGIKFCSALIMDSNDDPDWEATMQRSREMKNAKKRENEEREKERQAAKAAEREKRKRKMEIEQKKLDQDHQKFLSEKEAQAMSEREEVKRIARAKKAEGARAEKQAEEQRTQEWITERKRREQEQSERTENNRRQKAGLAPLDADGKNQRVGAETRARANSKDSSCSSTPESTHSGDTSSLLEERPKEDTSSETSSLRKDRKSRKESDGKSKDSSVDTTPTSTRSEHHISMKDMLMRGGAAEGAARTSGETAAEDDETDSVKAAHKKHESANNRRGGKKRSGAQSRPDSADHSRAAVSIELPAPRPPAPIVQTQQPASRPESNRQESNTPRLVAAAPISLNPVGASKWRLDAESDPPFTGDTNNKRWSLNAESDPELIPAAPSRNQWSLNSEDDPIVAPIGSIGRKVAPIGAIGSIGGKPKSSVAPIGGNPIGSIGGNPSAPGRW